MQASRNAEPRSGDMSSMGSNHEGLSDADAIARSERQPDLFRLVFERHFDAVWRYLRHRCGTTAADDLASETFARAFAARLRYRSHDTTSALPWLLGISANLVADGHRRELRRLRAYARSGLLETVTSGEDDLVARIAAQAEGRRLAAVLADLRAEDRETLLLSALGGLDHSEVARALGVAEGTVRSRLSRTRARLAPLFDPYPCSEETVHG
jgi:RNA polymerase sigma factor (sigma-70 family)